MDENYLEQAEALAQIERESGLQVIQSALGKPGLSHCEDCDDPIPPERHAAAPWANRCINCQTIFERTLHGRHR